MSAQNLMDYCIFVFNLLQETSGGAPEFTIHVYRLLLRQRRYLAIVEICGLLKLYNPEGGSSESIKLVRDAVEWLQKVGLATQKRLQLDRPGAQRISNGINVSFQESPLYFTEYRPASLQDLTFDEYKSELPTDDTPAGGAATAAPTRAASNQSVISNAVSRATTTTGQRTFPSNAGDYQGKTFIDTTKKTTNVEFYRCFPKDIMILMDQFSGWLNNRQHQRPADQHDAASQDLCDYECPVCGPTTLLRCMYTDLPQKGSSVPQKTLVCRACHGRSDLSVIKTTVREQVQREEVDVESDSAALRHTVDELYARTKSLQDARITEMQSKLAHASLETRAYEAKKCMDFFTHWRRPDREGGVNWFDVFRIHAYYLRPFLLDERLQDYVTTRVVEHSLRKITDTKIQEKPVEESYFKLDTYEPFLLPRPKITLLDSVPRWLRQPLGPATVHSACSRETMRAENLIAERKSAQTPAQSADDPLQSVVISRQYTEDAQQLPALRLL